MFKKPHFIILLLIICLSLFFRTYQIVERYGYAHDAELFGWIVKDIVVNHHPRLIGQLTSAPGIFIGPLFYYMLVPFFLIFKMNPVGALVPITIIGVLTTLSYFVVFSKLFNKHTGLIIAFLHAILLTWVQFDRKIVPSTPTNLWMVWYFYTIIQIARGNFFVLPFLGILIGLVWHIHIALLPTLAAIPFSFIVSKKLPKIKEVGLFLLSLFISNLPLFIFEIRHSFSQTKALIDNFITPHDAKSGGEKLIYMINFSSKNISNLFLSPYTLSDILRPLFVLLIILFAVLLIYKKIISKKEVIPSVALLLGVFGFFTLSSSPVSEYYLYSMEIIFVGILSLFLSFIWKNNSGKVFVVLFLSVLLIRNLYHFTTDYIYKKDYQERKSIVEYITTDAKQKGFPCLAVSYITSIGENTGFRYFFFLKNQQLIHPTLGVPVYNIVLPDELSKEVKIKFGHIGVIPPKDSFSSKQLQIACSQPNSNLTDPMFGYVD